MTATPPVTVEKRPVRSAAAVSILAALGVVWLVGETDAVRLGLLAELSGIVLIGGGLHLFRNRWRLLGGFVGLVGLGFVAVAVGVVATRVTDIVDLVGVVPGLVGALVLAAGVLPLRGGGSRALVKLGAFFSIVTVVMAGLVHLADGTTMVQAVALIVFAWDAGETSINVGRQLGRRGESRGVQAVHLAGTGAFALVAIYVAGSVGGVSGNASLLQIVALLAAVTILAVALNE